MSVAMSKAEGVTVLTLTSDPQSFCPPVCQILGSLCWSPACCSLNPQLGRRQRAQSALGTLQIMIGIFNIGLAALLTVSRSGSSWQMDSSGYPYWMGAIFIIFGIICILTEKFSSPCLVILSVMLHLAGVGFAIAAIVLYSINMGDISLWWWCRDDRYNSYDDYSYRRRHMTTMPTPGAEGRKFLQENCFESSAVMLMVLRGVNGILIVLAVLELCVVISVVVLQIKALACRGTQQKKIPEDPELYKPLMEQTA